MTIKAESKTWSCGAALDTPYKKAKAEWDSRIGSVVVQAKNWRLATFGALGLVLLALLGVIYLGTLPKVEPHIVEVNPKSGDIHYRGPISVQWSQFKPSEAAIIYHLTRFITDVREVSTDADLVKRNLLDAYNLLTREGANILNEHFRSQNPLQLVGKKRITVDITSMVPLSKASWQCDWLETNWSPQGLISSKHNWRAMFRIVMKKPQLAQQIEKNPIGLYIEEFHWSQVKR